MSVGPVGLMVLALPYLLWLGAVGLYWFFVFLIRFVVIVASLVWSLVMVGWAHIRARSSRTASGSSG